MFILSWSVSPSCSKLLISSSKLLFLTITLNVFQMKLKEFWLRIFTRFLKYQWWHNVYRFKGNCLQMRVLYPKFQKMSYFFDIHFPRSTIWHHNQVSFPLYDLFVCISLILLEYCSTDIRWHMLQLTCACGCVCVCVCTSINREGLICHDQLENHEPDQQCCVEDVSFLCQVFHCYFRGNQ